MVTISVYNKFAAYKHPFISPQTKSRRERKAIANDRYDRQNRHDCPQTLFKFPTYSAASFAARC